MNEMLFYGGISCAAFSIAAAIILTLWLRSRGRKLNARFDAEYGNKRK
jgi:hypothetical protein